ncbi:POZ domain-containing protein [Coniochaeta ligniaria NRRL 30616]|uniref:POZ domain-containing protein n=1 Tax=Coniochaeta ligniaria NRRL 30616 TaxID=1408157 RepID=A0A1J7IG38_9PEZI|nr:POZ domain-containing protein [Coniochaeta ligniaria NRRL 30616]
MDNRFLSSDQKLLESGLFADVTVTCKGRTWQLHKNILCSRSVWFEKALNGNFLEASTGVVDITNFEPEAMDWLITYIYTGVCDIAKLMPTRKTQFLTCIEVYTISDYFAMTPLAQIALDTLKSDFDSKTAPMQLSYEPIDYMDELLDAIRLVYQDIPLTDTNCDTNTATSSSSALRTAFVHFVFATRFFFLNNKAFSSFLDSTPVFALDLFRVMRSAADFAAHLPESYCSICRNKPTRSEKGHYTHLAPEKMKLVACCANCASKKEFLPPTEDWTSKSVV